MTTSSDEDDSLPSFKSILSSTPFKRKQQEFGSVSLSADPSPTKRRVPSVIPIGDRVLALWRKDNAHHPATVLSHTIGQDKKTKYHIEYWDGVPARIGRESILCLDDEGFGKAKISQSVLERDSVADEDEREGLDRCLDAVMPGIKSIYEGAGEGKSQRFEAFRKSGKSRAQLRVNSGSCGGFKKWEVDVISRRLAVEVESWSLPSSVGDDVESSSAVVENSSLISLVLFPETLVSVLVERLDCSGEEAEEIISHSVDWIDELLARHEIRSREGSQSV